MGHDQCIFCKILKNELEASFVYKGKMRGLLAYH